MGKWFPDRKVWAGGLFTVLAFLLILALNTWVGTDVPLEAVAMLSLALGKAGEYLLPPSVQDIIRRVDNDLVAIAAHSPASKVTAEVGAVAERARAGDDAFEAIMAQMRGGPPA